MRQSVAAPEPSADLARRYLERVGFHRINRWHEADTLGRKDRRWATQLFVLRGQGLRCLERMEVAPSEAQEKNASKSANGLSATRVAGSRRSLEGCKGEIVPACNH